jgi:UDP-N-acetylglucosamine--N-acetylmuramyl-(pentapeptide) pyrophosphoryl-undecaprenol N-acetylglucosamine transferase
MKQKKIHISAAGSGGHIVPAIEIANQLEARNYSVYFLTTTEKRAEAFISNNTLNIVKFPIKPYKYNSFYTFVATIFNLSINTIKSTIFFVRNRPDLLVITGGYLSMPLFLSSCILRIPYVVYEQNSVLGKANTIISKFAKKIFTGFEFKSNLNHKNKYIFTGNIIRDKLKKKVEIKKFDKKKKILNILVMGGSQGSKIINDVLFETLKDNKIQSINYSFTHICGNKEYYEIKKKYFDYDLNVEIFDYVDDISFLYNKSDLVICRAGAMTLSELIFFNIPSIIVPITNSSNNHQFLNAKTLHDQSCSIMIEEKNFNSLSLFECLKLIDFEKLKSMKEGCKKIKEHSNKENIIDNILLNLNGN